MAKFLRRASAIIVCLQISMTYVFAAPLETPGFSHHCEKVTCNSDSWGNKTCTHELPVNTLKCDVKLLRKDSLISGCELDQDYGVSPDCKNMWVDNGCRGEFELCIEREIFCDVVEDPSHGSRVGNNFKVGSSVEIKCDEGYLINGPTTLTCVQHADLGQWDATTPTCKEHVCGAPEAPINGNVVGDDYRHGSTVTYECNAGFKRVGESQATCGYDGWDVEPPSCFGCPGGYFSLLFGSSGSCFKAEDPLVEVDIEIARTACAADGAELISAPSMEEFEALRAWMIKELPSGTDIWVSMKWSGSDDSETQWNMGKHYTWADGTPAQDQMWAADEPSAPLYVAFRGDKDYRLENRAVNKKASYMCEKKLL